MSSINLIDLHASILERIFSSTDITSTQICVLANVVIVESKETFMTCILATIGEDTSALNRAIKAGKSDIVETLIDRQHLGSKRNEDLLALAVHVGNLPVIDLLMKASNPTRADLERALYIAACSGNVRVFNRFIDLSRRRHCFALFAAAERGHDEIVRALVPTKVRADVSDNRALMLAATNGHQNVVEILIASQCISRTYSTMAIRLAQKNGHAHLATFLWDTWVWQGHPPCPLALSVPLGNVP
jgi:hypothetical protein